MPDNSAPEQCLGLKKGLKSSAECSNTPEPRAAGSRSQICREWASPSIMTAYLRTHLLLFNPKAVRHLLRIVAAQCDYTANETLMSTFSWRLGTLEEAVDHLPACSSCRKRKLRCSRGGPPCEHCERLGNILYDQSERYLTDSNEVLTASTMLSRSQD